MAIIVSTLFISLGVSILIRTTLLSSGLAGFALLIQFSTGSSFWFVFFAINLPFYWFGWKRLGSGFVVRTFLAVSLQCILTRMCSSWIGFSHIDTFYAAILAGTLIGTGLLMLFRHRTSLGGISILALYLQDVYQIRAGYVQAISDCLLFVGAAFVIRCDHLLMSVVAAAICNGFIAIYHRPGRYTGLT